MNKIGRKPAKRMFRRYKSVVDALKGMGANNKLIEKVKNKISSQCVISTKLAVMRQKSEITQERMSEILGVSVKMVKKWEAGMDTNLTIGLIQNYCKVCKSSITIKLHPDSKKQ